MERKFILTCGSTVDMPYEYIVEQREIPVIYYTYQMNGKVCVDNMDNPKGSLDEFYQAIKDGALPSTSQINVDAYLQFFREQAKNGPVLHIAFGSGMSSSVNNAMTAAEMLKEEDPTADVHVVDSLGSSSGYGLLVDEAADRRDQGMTRDEVEQWVLSVRNTVHHQFYSTDLTMFRRGGRVSGPAAAIATILNICPIMHLNAEGRIIAYGKVRGKKNAQLETVRTVEEHIQNGHDYSGKIFICNSHCIEDAESTAALLRERFPKADIRIYDIGTIIGCHTGFGTVAVFFFGDERGME
ncbi:MAG: DegV family protein [Oscillospiraceae bacterium]|nr:DegV family protein [Oscillospiraceae bacterium]